MRSVPKKRSPSSPRVAEKIAQAKKAGKTVIFTRDTHQENYLQTQEGKNLPVPHCIENTPGWEIDPALDTTGAQIFDKPSFGSEELVQYLKGLDNLTSAEFVGLCTDICVITNVLSAKCALPELPIAVDSACCAGVTPDSHENALAAMRMCQIRIL